MAGVRGVAQTTEISTGTESSEAEKKTLLQLVAAANHRVKVDEISISFKGVDNTADPVLVRIFRQSSAGTMSALTPKKLNEADDETLQTTAQEDASVEPTTGDEIMGEEVHPQSGFLWQAPFGKEIIVKGGNRLAVVVTAAEAVDCKARMSFEE